MKESLLRFKIHQVSLAVPVVIFNQMMFIKNKKGNLIMISIKYTVIRCVTKLRIRGIYIIYLILSNHTWNDEKWDLLKNFFIKYYGDIRSKILSHNVDKIEPLGLGPHVRMVHRSCTQTSRVVYIGAFLLFLLVSTDLRSENFCFSSICQEDK